MADKIKFSEIGSDDTKTITFLVTEVKEKINSKGNPFCELLVSDGEASNILRLWNHGLSDIDFAAGDVLTSSVSGVEYRGGVSYSCQSWKKESNSLASEFVRTAPVPVSEMWDWIVMRSSSMREPYRSLMSELVLSRKEEYCHASAARSNHHNYVAGLLYHSYRMAKAADAIAPIYGVDSDLAVCGALLHDIGKLQEMSTDVLGVVEYTVEGQMEGHLLLGCQMIREAAKKIGEDKFDSDELLCLTHLIASHHGLQEMGAIREPMTKEAMLVSALDMLDMKLTVYEDEARNVVLGQMSPNYNPIVGKIYAPVSCAKASMS